MNNNPPFWKKWLNRRNQEKLPALRKDRRNRIAKLCKKAISEVKEDAEIGNSEPLLICDIHTPGLAQKIAYACASSAPLIYLGDDLASFDSKYLSEEGHIALEMIYDLIALGACKICASSHSKQLLLKKWEYLPDEASLIGRWALEYAQYSIINEE